MNLRQKTIITIVALEALEPSQSTTAAAGCGLLSFLVGDTSRADIIPLLYKPACLGQCTYLDFEWLGGGMGVVLHRLQLTRCAGDPATARARSAAAERPARRRFLLNFEL